MLSARPIRRAHIIHSLPSSRTHKGDKNWASPKKRKKHFSVFSFQVYFTSRSSSSSQTPTVTFMLLAHIIYFCADSRCICSHKSTVFVYKLGGNGGGSTAAPGKFMQNVLILKFLRTRVKIIISVLS